MSRFRELIAAAFVGALGFTPGAFAQPANSGFFTGTATQLLSATGQPVSIGGSGCTLASLVLTCNTGSGGTSGPQPRGYYLNTPTGYGPNTTGPYILIPYAVRSGTILGAYAMMHAADGANYSYTVSIVKAGTTNAINVPGLTNVPVNDGEGTTTNVASYQAPAHATATGSNTYAVGDLVQVSFSTVGGTYISTSFVLSDTE